MERMELKAFRRETGKRISKKLRREGNVPAILYGVGREPIPLFVGGKELDNVLGTEAGWNILLDLVIDDKDKVISRISEYQADVLRRDLTHIDFQVLDLKKKIRVEVPIRFIGKPEGVKKGGIMEVNRRSLEVKCLPTEIPEHIDIDVNSMDIGGNIHVEDVTAPAGAELIFDTNFSIAAIVAPTEELVAEIPAEGVAVAEAPEAVAPAEGEAAAAPAEAKKGEAQPEGEKKSEKKGEKK